MSKVKLTFKVSPMYDIYAKHSDPEYYTVLCKVKGKRKGWMYCADEDGEIIKESSILIARAKCNKIREKYTKET